MSKTHQRDGLRASIKAQWDDFIEYPTADQRSVTTVSALLFAEHIAQALYAQVEQHQHFISEAAGSLGCAPAFPDLIDAISSAVNKVEQLTREVERTSNNRDMWKAQCERQAYELAALREQAKTKDFGALLKTKEAYGHYETTHQAEKHERYCDGWNECREEVLRLTSPSAEGA